MADTSASGPVSGWLRPLPLIAFLTPVVAAPSGRALVGLLVLAAFLAGFEEWRAGRLRSLLLSPLALWVYAVAGFGALSMLWARAPHQATAASVKFLILGLAGLTVLQAARRAGAMERSQTATALLAGMAAAIFALWVGTIYGHETGRPLWGTPGQHPLATLSQGQTVIAVLTVPALAILWRRDLKYLAAALALAIAVAFANLVHEASAVAVGLGAAAFAVAWFAGRWGSLLVGLGLAVSILAMPIIIDLMVPTAAQLTAKLGPHGPWPSSIHREFMWRFVLDSIVGDHFWLGHGLDASRGFPGATRKIMWGIELMPLHPHNGALQAWLELGPVGAMLAAFPAALVGIHAARISRLGGAIGVSILAAYAAPWLVSFGVWQSWWLALAWLAAAIGVAATGADDA